LDKRKVIQVISTFLYNPKIFNFFEGKIHQGQTKSVCVPGLNCYSCPGAIGSCPLGSLQNSIANPLLKFPFYILGLLLLFGLLLGRLICGFLCPFGLIQELLYKIPIKKIKKSKVTYYLSYLKYFILVIFVILIPLYFIIVHSEAVPAFCKYICPAGTLEAGVPLVLANNELKVLTGNLFLLKISILVITLILVTSIYRAFCRFICPLGAIYSLFNKISVFGIAVDMGKCTHCNKCVESCKMDVKKVGDRECIACGECKKVCKFDAISFKPKIGGQK